MTDRMTTDQMIEVLQAYKSGKKIESRSLIETGAKWFDMASPTFGFDIMEYRVKHEPIEFWVAAPTSAGPNSIEYVYGSKDLAESYVRNSSRNLKIYHVREVEDDGS